VAAGFRTDRQGVTHPVQAQCTWREIDESTQDFRRGAQGESSSGGRAGRPDAGLPATSQRLAAADRISRARKRLSTTTSRASRHYIDIPGKFASQNLAGEEVLLSVRKVNGLSKVGQ
jgi:hypothetical protein